MICNEVRPLLDLLCDGVLEAKDSALVLDHLKSCNECQHDWNELEQLRTDFQQAKDKPQMPAGLMEKISQKIREEEKSQYSRSFKQYASSIPMLAIAATIALIGFLFMPWIQQFDTKSIAMQKASADILVDDILSQKNLEQVSDKNELTKRVGYELKYVRLPEWQMDNSGVYKSAALTPIARFDFIRKGPSGDEHLSCYQSPQGMIQAKVASPEDIEGKHVLFGNHGKFNFALWSQNGRDYLFVTALSKPQLEEIIRGS